MKTKIIAACAGVFTICVLVAAMIPEKTVRHPDGVLCPEVPVQMNIAQPKPFMKGDFMITPLAEFSIKGRVLSRENYHWDACSALSPTDLAMGWEGMSDQKVVDMLDITQGSRWYYWKAKEALPLPQRTIERCSANMHIIPANDQVADALGEVCRGNIIFFAGYLVKVTKQGGWRWISSLTRDDTGDGACEVVYVEHLRIIS